MIPSREQAYALLCRYNQSEALRKHALAVEGCMRHFAKRAGQDEELWGLAGLLHDLDYEMYPQEHCAKGAELLRAEGVDESIVRAMLCHGYGICTDVEPQTEMEKTLYAVDELTGLINACAIMRPSKSVMDLELKSVKKKFKQSSFAAGVNRQIIQDGADRLGMELDTLIQECILGMRECAQAIDLG